MRVFAIKAYNPKTHNLPKNEWEIVLYYGSIQSAKEAIDDDGNWRNGYAYIHKLSIWDSLVFRIKLFFNKGVFSEKIK